MDRRELLLVAALASTLTGCAQTPPADTPLAGTEWLLAELPGHPLPAVSAGAAQRPSLRIEGDPPRAIGNTSVNGFVGTAQIDGASGLRFGPLATTRRAGPPAAMQLESAYLAALGTVRNYRTGPGTLDLLDANGQAVARFATAAAASRR
jgi:heat shock protein HslJ